MATWTLDRFEGGLDVRHGAFSPAQNRFRTLTNRYVTLGEKLSRRMPLKQSAGTFGTDTSGLIVKDSVTYTLAPRGGGTVLPTGVVALEFDAPPGATVSTLIDVVALNNVPVALLLHTINGAQFYALHVFDNDPNQFTYVNDVGFPWTTRINPTTRPCLGVAAGKIYCGGPTGDTYFSAVAKPRVWNLRTTDNMIQGRDFIFYLGSAGNQSLTLPLNFSDYSGYFPFMIVQKFIGDALSDFNDETLWSTLTDSSNATNTFGAANEIRYTDTPNTKVGATVTTFGKINANPSVGGVFYRARIVRTPVARVVTGAFLGVAFGGTTCLIQLYTGNAAKTRYELPDTFYYVASAGNWRVLVNGVVQANPAAYTIVQVGNHAAAVAFVAAPANGALIEIQQLVNSGTSLQVVIPPGTVRSFDGSTQNFIGGVITLPASTAGLDVYIKFKADGTIDAVTNGGLTFTLPGLGLNMLGNRLYYSARIFGCSTNGVGVSSYTYPSIPELNAGPPVSERALAGYNDAGYLPTSKQPSGGGLVTDLTGTKDRLLVRYAGGAQVWSVHGNPSLDAIVSLIPVGSGSQTNPSGVLFFTQMVIVPASTGIRAVSLTNQLVGDSLHDDQDIGEAISGLGAFLFQAGAFWPKLGMYLAAGTINGVFSILVFVYRQDGKVAAWSQFSFTGLNSVDTRGMAAVDNRLYIRSGSNLFYLDAGAVIGGGQFYDYNETPTTAYLDRSVWHFNAFKQPTLMKEAETMDVLQTGLASFRWKVNPYDETMETGNIVIQDTTLGRGAVPVCAAGMGLAWVMESRDPNGHQLDGISLSYRTVKR